MVNRKSTNFICLTIALASLAYLAYSLYPLPPKHNLKPHAALGQVMAEQAIERLGPNGRLILLSRDASVDGNPAPIAQLRAFTEAAKGANATLGATNLIMMDPLRMAGVPSGDFLKVLLRSSEADVVVSFFGPPALSPGHLLKLRELKKNHAKVIALCPGEMRRQINLRAVMEANLLHVAVLSRLTADLNPPATDTAQGWFDDQFVLVTDPADPNLSPAQPTAPAP